MVDKDNVAAGEAATIQIELEREFDSEGELPPVTAPHYPGRKDENWWLVLGDPKKGTLLAIKRITLQRKTRVKLDLTAPAEVSRHCSGRVGPYYGSPPCADFAFGEGS